MNPEEQEAQKMQKRIDDAHAELEKAIKDILRKPIQNLTLEDKRFLQARRMYLDDSVLRKYDAILKEKLPRPDGQPNQEEEQQLDLMVRKDLEAMAIQLGISDAEDKKVFKTNASLIEAIKKVQEEQLKDK